MPSVSRCPIREKGRLVDNSLTMRSAYERINAGDIAGFGELMADDFVEHEIVEPGTPPTKEGVLAFFETLRTSFPDMHMAAEDVIAADDKTVARVTLTGTHRGEFAGVPPTDKAVEVKMIDIMRFDDAGLICEHWGVADMLSLMQQLGAVPASPTA
jgi:steroid delta-isomerase-like uncharacterized protein